MATVRDRRGDSPTSWARPIDKPEVVTPRRPTLRLAIKTVLMTGMLVTWAGHVWVNSGNVGEIALGTAITVVLSLQLLGSLNREADAAWGPGCLRETLAHRVGPPAVQALAGFWSVGLFTPYRFPIMIMTTVAAICIAAATELVADPRWLTWRGTIAAVAITVGIAVGATLTMLVIVFVVAAGAIILLIGLGLARRAWR